jgi:nucleotide-binding universal stress UspA family protein
MEARSKPAALHFRKLLVGFELGESCEGAVARALELADLFDGRVEVVHAMGASGLRERLHSGFRKGERKLEPEEVGRLDLLKDGLKTRVGDLLQKQRHDRKEADEMVSVAPGRPATVLVEHALGSRADAILLGGLRERGLVDVGSTARGLLAKAPCAVWIQRGAPTPIRRILVALDFSAESRRALATAIELAQRMKGSVHVVHVFDPGPSLPDDNYPTFENMKNPEQVAREEFDAEMAEVDWRGVEHTSEMLVGAPAKRIVEKESAADLLMLGTHGRTGFAAAVIGSVAYSVLVHTKKPVCVVRDPSRAFALD